MSFNPTSKKPEAVSSREQEERIKRFLATASHDLQSPLRHIAMYAEILLDDLQPMLDSEQLQSLKTIMDKAQTAQRLTKALMGFAGTAPQITINDVHLGNVTRDAWRQVLEEFPAGGASLDADNLPLIRSDAALLTIVLKHLFSNALDHHGTAPPHVTVTATREGADWRITVADNGCGIEPAYQERIFDAFWKLPKADKVSGPGLGLTITRELLGALGGDISLNHSDESGSRFAIRLPA
ncbi:signal transduction histidine kinase [Rhizobium sp. BK650]|uniref:sensor histidine kinase n=1 Tax=Rhizobium sp. BK650 TaxID=2586990 RepID=UPI00161C2AB4|nr:HAMP domain-containing sensor histidine kinase [Rhizobium sp. BK650]MBB3656213.1 signal transduction histidine kinase [Rhizobium sp. BK650]